MVSIENKKNISGLIKYLSRYKRYIVLILILIIVSIVLEIGIAWVIKEITDNSLNGNYTIVTKYLIFGLIFFLLNAINDFGKSFYTGKLGEKTIRNIKKDAYDHIQKLPISYYEKGRSGDLLSRFSNDCNLIINGLKFHLLPLISNPLLALCAFAFLFTLHWKLALICAATGPLTYFVGKYFSGKISYISKKTQKILGESNSFLNDSIEGVHIVKSFCLEKNFSNKYENYCDEIYDKSLRMTFLQSCLNGVSFFVGSSSFMVTFGFGIYFVMKNELTIGELWAFVQLINRIIWPFSALARVWGSFVSSLVASGRIFELYNIPVEEKDKNVSSDSLVEIGKIAFKNVYFGYNNDDIVLQDINFFAEPGQVVALVGPSGAGKSTIFKLLLKFYAPLKGQILINDKDITYISNTKVREKCSYVSQDVFLFHGTIEENIRLGKEDATLEEITKVAMGANIHDFIEGLPQGYQTLVGERGVNFSGGERQRISIARALLKNAPILLLDEPTSSLDSRSENLVKEALNRLMRDKTTLVIAHRLSTIEEADQIVVIDKGRVKNIGKHLELLKASEIYKKLYERQAKRDNGLLGSI